MTNASADNIQAQSPPAQRDARARKLIRVDIEREGKPGFSAIVTNLSELGMGGRTEGLLRPFELITIVKKGYGRIAGEVRWTEGQNFGVQFSEPIDVDQFNFINHNKQKQSAQGGCGSPVWTGYKTTSSPRRPGLTSRHSR